jgi:hypothetical protein
MRSIRYRSIVNREDGGSTSTPALTSEDSNFDIPSSKNTFEMSTEFPAIWPAIRPGDFCS